MIIAKTKGVVFEKVTNEKSFSDFRAGLRSAVRGFWTGALTESEFTNAFADSIEFRLREAYITTARRYGINENEFTDEEEAWINNFIIEQIAQISNFTGTIAENQKPNGKLTPLLDRVELWTNRYTQVENNARTFFAENQKLIWTVSPNKVHCSNCGRLDGRVKRASQWREYPLEPQSPRLACGGWKCGCALNETDLPLSKGPLPRP